jgi:hypothetical protein
MSARPLLRILAIAGLLISLAARALAAGDEPEGGGTPGSTTTTTTTTTGGDANSVSPLGPAETTTVQAPPPVVAPPPKRVVELEERTAYMVGEHKLKIGILAFEYGIMRQLSVGTDPPSWALRAFTSVLVPNLHLKFQIFDRDPVAVAVQAAGYYGDISRSNFNGNVLDIPLTLFVSVKVHPRITLHAEGAYVFARVFGTGDLTQATLSGATAVRAGQVGLVFQYRVTRIFSLTATGRYQFYSADLPLSGSSMTDPYTTASLNGQFVPPVEHPWEAIGGVAFLWEHFRLTLGAGYGYYFLPGLDIANTKKTFVPDASIAVVL